MKRRCRRQRSTGAPEPKTSSDARRRLVATSTVTRQVANEREDILSAVDEALTHLLADAEGTGARLLSCMFVVPSGLDAAFPAEAARRRGLNDVALFCLQGVASDARARVQVVVHHEADDLAAR